MGQEQERRRVPVSTARRRFGFLTAGATLALIFVGGLVTSTGSGLAVPDWPLSYGMLMPPMVGGVFYEHGHRMVAASVGLLTLILAFWTARVEARAWVRRVAWLCLATVVVQGLLGGLTVLFLLPTPISVTHACLAQVFFCLVLLLAYSTSREWQAAAAEPAPDRPRVRPAAVLATLCVFVQLLLGALMRHLGAGLAIPDFPWAFGGLLPTVWSDGVAVHFAHRVGALGVAAAFVPLVRRCRGSGDPALARHATALCGLLVLQVALGAATVLGRKAVLPTTAHVATGAAVLGGVWLLTLRAHRRLRQLPGPQRAAARAQAAPA